MEIRELNTDDRAEIRAWHDVLFEGYTGGRPPVWWSGIHEAFYRFENPSTYSDRIALVGLVDGEIVAAADATLPNRENTDSASIELAVQGDRTGRGHGRALAEDLRNRLVERGRTTVDTEVYGLPGQDFSETRGGRFAAAHGLEVANVETRYLLELPVASMDAPLDAPLDTDVEIVGWVGPCPLQYEAQLLLLQQQMEQDVPRGELSRRPLDLDLERQRDSQRRLAERGWTSVTALAMVNGESAGYTEVLVQDRDRVMVQEDTLVLPAHRGRRIGQALKADNLRRLDGVRDGRTMLQTFIADSNVAMRATNAKFGFEAADVLYECEGRI
ncbi:hypothetical protein EU513_04845 [Yimella sp. RIT 621]|uniref:hypothetical protein n=1 Tax=Yimella sp. RIT 621 TaxID=2510323 RepID=UPI00101D5D63|nr:hypothetical protein [Yimella sp. RIT 621]RYG77890.1 hypothetical protein EU513_04845 [Yimella sp. RIT 621]